MKLLKLKFIKEGFYNDEAFGIGMEIVLHEADAADLIQNGIVEIEAHLDPENVKDNGIIEKFGRGIEKPEADMPTGAVNGPSQEVPENSTVPSDDVEEAPEPEEEELPDSEDSE